MKKALEATYLGLTISSRGLRDTLNVKRAEKATGKAAILCTSVRPTAGAP